MTDLIVIGAGGSAGAIVEMVNALNDSAGAWILQGFLDDDDSKHGSTIAGVPVLGHTRDAAGFSSDTQFVSGVANYHRPEDRLRMVQKAAIDPRRFATLLHPRASVSAHARIGSGVLAMEFVVISDSSAIANHAMLSPFAYVAHHASVGEGTILAPRSSVLGGARIGRSAYIGAHSVVRDGITVGDGAVVGMGAVVIHDVDPFSKVVGNPARVIPG